uniref:Phosphoribosyl pyrophosphate synthase-like n=1 Tax=Oryza sativa subsp. japonica TaxID=39947 RepID=Q64M76_ORYSJ|nr:phosphoribosyl pyrophosphate synthase-like [Oryza sativa Japonica Group]
MEKCPNWKFVWENKAPMKVQFFAWLLTKDRFPIKRNLHKKTIVPAPTCELCNSADETALHLCFQCPFAVTFWSAMNIPSQPDGKHSSDVLPVPALSQPSSSSRLRIFSGTANPTLAQEVAFYLGMELGRVKIKRFTDGGSVRGCDMFLVQATCPPPNENMMELLIMIDGRPPRILRFGRQQQH